MLSDSDLNSQGERVDLDLPMNPMIYPHRKLSHLDSSLVLLMAHNLQFCLVAV